MENTQTAVEWLFDKLFEENPNGELKYHLKHDIINLFEQAKEMERKQITEAWNDGNLLGRNGHVLLPYDNGNGYYNENFN